MRYQKKPHRMNDGVNLFENRKNFNIQFACKNELISSTESNDKVCSLITAENNF